MITIFIILASLAGLVLLWFVIQHFVDRFVNPLRTTIYYESGTVVRVNLKEIQNTNPINFAWIGAGSNGRSYLVGMTGANPVAITALDRRKTLFYR